MSETVLAAHRAPAGEHFVEDAPERPDIGSLVHIDTARLLGAHVRRRSENDAGARRVRGNRRRLEKSARSVSSDVAFARPKSSTFTIPSARDLDVRRLQVPMDDAALVRGVQRLGELSRDRERFAHRNRAWCDPIRQREPLDQLEDERHRAIRFLEPWMCAMFGWFSVARSRLRAET